MKVWLLIHSGYDFDPTTLAVCSDSKKARAMMAEHYSDPTHEDHPWNGCYVQEVETDAWVKYDEDANVLRSFGTKAPPV